MCCIYSYSLKTAFIMAASSMNTDQTAPLGAGAVSNVSGYRCVSDCRSRGRKFGPGLVPDHEIFVSFERKYVHEVLINCLFKLAQEKL